MMESLQITVKKDNGSWEVFIETETPDGTDKDSVKDVNMGAAIMKWVIHHGDKYGVSIPKEFVVELPFDEAEE